MHGDAPSAASCFQEDNISGFRKTATLTGHETSYRYFCLLLGLGVSDDPRAASRSQIPDYQLGGGAVVVAEGSAPLSSVVSFTLRD